jgi:cytoskeletal protein CcmA (bactofilin family)
MRFASRIAVMSLLAALGTSTASARADSANPRDQVVVSGSVDVPVGRAVGTVVIVDGPVNVAGTVDGEVVAIHGDVRVSGTVKGSVTAVSGQVTLAPGARVEGDIRYHGSKPAIAPGAVVTGRVRNEGLTAALAPGLAVVAYLAVWLAVSISALVLGVLMWALAPRADEAAFRACPEQTGSAVGWGIGLFLGLPVVAIIAVATLVGIPFGLGLLLALLPLSAVGYVTAAYILGRLILPRQRSAIAVGLAGLGIVRVIALVPFLSVITWFAMTVIGLGALWVAIWRSGGAAAPAGGQSATTTQ